MATVRSVQFEVQIRTEGAAFGDDDRDGGVEVAREEVARILARLATALRRGDDLGRLAGALVDANGNRCGAWQWRRGAR